MNYPVNNIYSCLQGEGVNSGLPMIMLRLHGCAVGCPWCDTKETWDFDLSQQENLLSLAMGQNSKYSWQDEKTIARLIQECYPDTTWILLSGGEPANYILDPLLAELKSYGHKIALETSGTEEIHGNPDWICVSPKIDMPGKKTVKTSTLNKADEIKMVIGKPEDLTKLEILLKVANLKPSCQICLQPVSQSEKATKLCIDECLKRDWRLSIQVHKYLRIE